MTTPGKEQRTSTRPLTTEGSISTRQLIEKRGIIEFTVLNIRRSMNCALPGLIQRQVEFDLPWDNPALELPGTRMGLKRSYDDCLMCRLTGGAVSYGLVGYCYYWWKRLHAEEQTRGVLLQRFILLNLGGAMGILGTMRLLGLGIFNPDKEKRRKTFEKLDDLDAKNPVVRAVKEFFGDDSQDSSK